MIYVDERVGSKEFADLLDNAVLVQLDYGDFSFEGNGPTGKIQVGIERKAINDLISSISTGRLTGHQLPGLLDNYQRVYLIVEGQWRTDRKSGVIEVFRHGKFRSLGQSRFTGKRLWGYLISISATVQVEVLITTNTLETVVLIEEMYHWWNQPWDKHEAHVMSVKAAPQAAYLVPGRMSLMKRIASELPGIGAMKLAQVEKTFGTVERMVAARREDWMVIEGVGPLTADKIWRALHE